MPHPLKIAVASGKGGTGKTTVATSLALCKTSYAHCLVDCDVEAPNAHLFVKVISSTVQIVYKPIPVIRQELCAACGKCAEACQFNAITVQKRLVFGQPKVLVFADLCHSCGACTYVCPEHAIFEQPEPVGIITTNVTDKEMVVYSGEMKIGTAMPVPVIKAVQKLAEENAANIDVILYDAPPGNSCSVVETLKDCDFVVLVTEPTPFGLHDLKLTVELTRNLKKPFGVVLNRSGIGNDDVENFLTQEHIPLLLKIPFDASIARQLSAGIPLIEQSPFWETAFQDLHQAIRREVKQ